MRGERTFYVTPVGEESPFEVVVRPAETGWSVTVSRDGETRAFRLAPGPAEGLAWADDRPLRYRWEPAAGSGTLYLGGAVHRQKVESSAERRLAELGIRTGPTATGQEIRSPMPGLVLELEVADGDAVSAGDGIAIIEAMKMENEITAPIAGVVLDVAVASGQPVEQDALICRIEPPEAEGEEEPG